MEKGLSDTIIKKLVQQYGEVAADLDFGNTYQLTIAVVLSAQTTDRQVNAATVELFERYPDFKSLAKASQGDVERIIRSTGFYHNKAKNIIALSKEVMGRFKGSLPRTREELVTLPGVGRKSANVILSMGYGIPALAVDTHVLRIANRLGYCSTKNPLEAEKALIAVIPEEQWTMAHLLIIRHGRATCKAQRPLCGECSIRDLCHSPDKTLGTAE